MSSKQIDDRLLPLASVCADDAEVLAISVARFIAAGYMTSDVLIGTLRRTPDARELRRRDRPVASRRTSCRTRSIVAALIARSEARTSAWSSRWPCRSMAATRIGNSALSRLPQIRSPASQSTISAERTRSS